MGFTDVYMGDWFHIMLVSGIFNLEVAFLMTYLSHINIGWPALQRFLESWRWPHGVQPPHKELDKPINEEGLLKMQGSTCLNAYPIIRLFLIIFVAPLERFHEQIDSFLRLCDVLDILLRINHGVRVAAENLERAVESHFNACMAAYHDLAKYFLPKVHMEGHLAEWYAKFKCLIALFTNERKHKTIKGFVRDRKKLTSYERGLIEKVTQEHLQVLEDGDLARRAGLMNPTEATPEVIAVVRRAMSTANRVLQARVVRISGILFHAGDIVWCEVDGGNRVGELWWHNEIDGGQPMSVVSFFADIPDAEPDSFTRTVARRDDPRLINSARLKAALMYRSLDEADGRITVVIPPEFW